VSGSAAGGRKRRRKGSVTAVKEDDGEDVAVLSDAAAVLAAGATLLSTPATSADGDRWSFLFSCVVVAGARSRYGTGRFCNLGLDSLALSALTQPAS
jgi:hypothetical protein